MPACQRLNRFSLLFCLCGILVPSVLCAQWTMRDPLASPPPLPAGETPQPQPVPAQTQPQDSQVPSAVEPALQYQPGLGTAQQLPQGYQPSRSALDPVEKPQDAESVVPGADETMPNGATATETSGNEPGPPVKQEPEIIHHTPDKRSYIAVKMQGLDKITARRMEMEATMGTVTSFGNLEIVPRACWQSKEEDKPDAAALLEIWQWKPGEKPSFVFFGWMFASSPGLSSLEHPIYDLTVLECIEDPEDVKKRKAEQKKAAEAARKAAKAQQEKDAELMNQPQFD